MGEEKQVKIIREEYASKLLSALKKLKINEPVNLAFTGPEGIGKTHIIKNTLQELAKREGVSFFYLPLSRISTSPENLSIELLARIISWLLGEKRRGAYADIPLKEIEKKVNETKSVAVASAFSIIANELEKIKPDQELLLKTIFNLPSRIADEKKAHLIVALDDFHEILDLRNYPQLKDLQPLFTNTSKNSAYIIASEEEHEISSVFNETFEIVTVKGMTREEMKALSRKMEISRGEQELLIELAMGYPAFLEKINAAGRKEGLMRMAAEGYCKRGSPLYEFSQHIYSRSITRTRGQALIKTILRILSLNPPMRLSELSRKIYRLPGVTKSNIERMIRADIIVQQDKKLRIKNRIMETWASLINSGYEITSGEADKKLIEEIEKKIREVASR